MKSQNKWFTLIEIIISITILSVIMVSVFSIYWNLISINKKLEVSRAIQENTKSITESIATSIRNNWIDYSRYNTSNPDTENRSINYSDWNNILFLSWWKSYYLAENISWTSVACSTSWDSCYLYDWEKRISDERVSVSWLRFYISWKWANSLESDSYEWKVTIVFDLKIAKISWVSIDMAKNYETRIQTTISERAYKSNN